MTNTEQLLFEKPYELLQEITYSINGNFKKTKNIKLKAPTFKDSEKLEMVVKQLNPVTAIINFICENQLIVTQDDNQLIPASSLRDFHVKAYRKLANDYCNFFLVSEPSETQ